MSFELLPRSVSKKAEQVVRDASRKWQSVSLLGFIKAKRIPVALRPVESLSFGSENTEFMGEIHSGRARSASNAGSPAGVRDRLHYIRKLRVGAALTAFAWGVLPGAAKGALDFPLVVTQVPASVKAPPASWNEKRLVRANWYAGARLVLVSPAGDVRVLSEGFESACDPNVSFDGQKLLFSGRKERNARWRIWEMALDGTGLRAITPETLDAHQPIYTSPLFTLNSPQPWTTLLFVGSEATAQESAASASTNLYNIKLDGSELRRLTYGPSQNLDPFQMWDGRVVYSANRSSREPSNTPERLGLFAIHIEGADMDAYGGELGARAQQMPCATEGGLVLFVENETPAWDGGGQLACVDEQRPHKTHRVLTKDAEYRYLSPVPLAKNQVLVARHSTRGKGTWGLVRFDADTGAVEPLFDSREFHEVQAVAVKPRNQPDGHSTVVTTDADFGTLYGLNCYTADSTRAGKLKRGEVKRVRVIEGLQGHGAKPGENVSSRLVGEAPVEADGSFNVVVPADTPLQLQTLDERGLSLGTCGWIWVKPKEVRGCIGCHEDPERVPDNAFVLALHRPSDRLLAPQAERRALSFQKDIKSILQQSCATATCHGDRTAPRLALSTPEEQRATHRLLTSGSSPVVDAGRARTSRLIWSLVGADTSRPWDATVATTPATPPVHFKPVPAHAEMPTLSAEDLRTLIQWIDLGAAFETPEALPAPVTNETPKP